MHLHNGGQVSVMRLLSRHSVVDDQPLPFFQNFQSIGQQAKELADANEFAFRFSGCHAESILFKRASGHRPKFG